MYDDDKGEIRTDRAGNKQLRPPHLPVLCDRRGAKKCPRGHHSNPTGVDAATWAIYSQIKECDATGVWPNSSILRSFAKTVRLAEESAKRSKDRADAELQIQLAILQASRRGSDRQ